MDMETYKSVAYKRSRIAYSAQCTFDYLITLLISDAFLAKLLTNIGMSDALIGIISSFISFAFLFQLLSIELINRIKNIKGTVVFFDCLSQALCICMYFVPFLKVGLGIKTGIVIGVIIAAYFSKYLVSSILFNWANSYVEPRSRGGFSAVKEMISLFSGMFFSLAVGFLADKYEVAGNIKGGFVFIIVLLSVLNVLNFVSLMMIKNTKPSNQSSKMPLKEVMANTIGKKDFRSVILLLSMWSIAVYMTNSFMGIFKTKDLLLSLGTVQIINMVANGMRLVCSLPLGKYSDKKSYAKGIELALIIAAVGFALNMFTQKNTWWLIIAYTILYSVSVAGTNANKLNITYSYVKSEYITQAMAIQNCISGVLGFGASLVGSFILSYIQKNGNMLFGISVYGQQVLSAISLLIVIGAIVYDRLVVEKQNIMVQ